MAHPRTSSSGRPLNAVPQSLEHHRVLIGGLELHVISHELPAAPDPDPLLGLSSALREVARLAARGLDNASIAKARGTSQRTVAKQLELVYERLSVDSRVELAALLADTHGSR